MSVTDRRVGRFSGSGSHDLDAQLGRGGEGGGVFEEDVCWLAGWRLGAGVVVVGCRLRLSRRQLSRKKGRRKKGRTLTQRCYYYIDRAIL